MNSEPPQREVIKKNQSKMKATITEIKTLLEGINSALDETQDPISDLENNVVKYQEK